jgi:hypothetical protein
MATKLKVVETNEGARSSAPEGVVADIVPSPEPPSFEPAPTRNRHDGWTAERQRKFIEHLSLSGSVGEASALAGVSSRSAYRLRNKAGAESFARAWDAALSLSATRLAAIAFDRALHGRSERIYRDGELVMERKMPSDYLLTWLLSRLDPLMFGSPTAKALAAATGDPRDRSRQSLPQLTASLADVADAECPIESGDYLDERLGEVG